ncbi:DUF853 family protein [candidate division KSB1 bacterium]|nr:DUF853 family protein [candidate division KSB1 bacterium]
MEDFEKLGLFYLGRVYDLKENKSTPNLLLYDSKDLTTHAVCVGMTGSGKTGLCVSLLEEAAIDGIPVLIIDPKGDMTNLALTFPGLSPQEFLPWISKDEARKKNLSETEFAAQQADLWKTGLQNWGQSAERIQNLKNAAELSIFTPGSTAGQSVSILRSFAAPPQQVIDETDAFGERIANTATSILGLLGIDADPLKSREHILLSTIFNYFWSKGRDMDLSALIQSVQSPPFTKIGVFDLDSFFPPKERFELAMTLNNLLAAPAFQSWLEGEALDINHLLYTDTGKPRLSVFYIAHLSDTERMFFVSLLLNQLLGWMRMQSGTTSLRAILYIDELFGYMPPIGNPPSKKPLLTLLKQARAFGLGVVLSTQNPVDLDYKGLSNTGTWFIGRLQTDRDRDRVLDGLEGVTGSDLNRKDMERIISGLGKRKFLLHNIHEDGPEIFETRWAMSYLCGPLTRNQIKQLVTAEKLTAPVAAGEDLKSGKVKESSGQPILAPDIQQFFVPVKSLKPQGATLYYRPYLYGSAIVHFTDNRKGVDLQENVRFAVPIENAPIPVNWEKALPIDIVESKLLKTKEESPRFEPIPAAATKAVNYKSWTNDFTDYLYRSQKVELLKSETFKSLSNPGESERDFRIRLSQFAREQRDEWTDILREKYAVKTTALERKIRTAEDRLSREREQSKQQKLQTAISVGATILGAFMGRKKVSSTTISRAGTAMRSASRSQKEAGDVTRAADNLEILKQELEELQAKFQQEINDSADKFDIQQEVFDTVIVRPLKSNIQVQLVSFVWMPGWLLEGGTLSRA